MLKLSKHLGSKPTITPPKRSIDMGNDGGDLVQGTDRFSADREGPPPGDGPLGAGGGLGRCQNAMVGRRVPQRAEQSWLFPYAKPESPPLIFL